MRQTAPECPVCRVQMELGHLLDMGNGDKRSRVSWIEGEPERGAFMGYKVKGKRQIATITYRCPRCGWLVWFAPEPEPEENKL